MERRILKFRLKECLHNIVIPVCSQFVVGQVIVGHVEDLERSEVAEHILADVVDDVVRDVELLEMSGAGEDAVGEDWHAIVSKVDLLQLVRNPLGLREHFLGDEGDLVEGKVEAADAETVLEQPMRLVLQLLQGVVTEINVSEGDQRLKGSGGNVGQVIVTQVKIQ